MHYSYDANFKLMVIKHTEESSNCAVARKFCVMEQIVWQWRKQKLPLLKGVNSNIKKHFLGPRWTISIRDEELLQCVIGKWKNGPPLIRKTKQMHCNDNSAERFQSQPWFGSSGLAVHCTVCSCESFQKTTVKN